MATQQEIESLVKAWQAGNFNVAPDQLRQGAATQIEDCEAQYINTTFQDKHIILQKDMTVKKAKSTWIQFVRRLSYGQFGGSAQLEGAVGQEQTSDVARVGVPMCFYSEIRRTTLASNLIETMNGQKAEDMEGEAADLRLAGDFEFDFFRGKDDFSNAGVFDGNPLAMSAQDPAILGLQAQIRQSDSQANAQDQMFLAYGGALSSVINQGGTLTQEKIEDAALRSNINHGSADVLCVDPFVKSAYNKIMLASNQRVMYPGAVVERTGTSLKEQSVSEGEVKLKSSRFLSGKFQPQAPRGVTNAPTAPSFAVPVLGGVNVGTSFVAGQVFTYKISASNELSESAATATQTATIGVSGETVALTITPGTNNRWFNVYRSAAGSTVTRFIGRVVNSGAATTTFTDRNNKVPGFVTCVLQQSDVYDCPELAPYSSKELAHTDLTAPRAYFRFATLRCFDPKKLVLIDNCVGSL